MAVGGAGVADGTRAGDEHRTNRCSQRPGQRRNLIANDLQRTAVATCTDGILKKMVSIRVTDACAADTQSTAASQPTWLCGQPCHCVRQRFGGGRPVTVAVQWAEHSAGVGGIVRPPKLHGGLGTTAVNANTVGHY